ncbi:uncharacterized protein LOC118227291 isoform X1 [Anguilla anguilla]|uniref:uncharacterized protein LOC118227291 isoform X1 n=1 Tax=Anguilla anguilla TaxID=7936 RepID=UPI0015AA285D|nr:uncharacterized protein LOC118227291 isoform X1 [Anguilla anguilla]
MNTAMKMSALLILVLFGSLELVSSDKGSGAGVDCCPSYDKRKIPVAMVVSWHKTSGSCAKAAYVFVDKRGKRICVDPTHGWVRSYAARVNSRSATTVVPGTSEMNIPERVPSAPGSGAGADCCTSYETKNIPVAMVVSWHKTSSSCAKAAYVFVTKLGKRICVDPTDGWVRSHAAQVDSRSATTVVPGTSKMNTPKRVPSGPLGPNTGSNCCPDIKKGPKIPLAMVASYHKTSSSCAKAAVVFVTKRRRRICLNPSEGWVRSHMTRVDSRSRKVTTV